MTLQYQEKPVQFGPSRSLFGMLCRPITEEATTSPVVVMPNSGLIHRVGANRIHVLIARALAHEGVPSLRFDLSGIGDSDRRTEALPLADAVNSDLADALQFLATQGADNFVLLGLCSGAYDGLQLAQRDCRVVGVIAIDVPGSFRNLRHLLIHYRKQMLTLTSWRNAVLRPERAMRSLGWRLGYVSETPSGVADGVRPILSRREFDDLLRNMNDRGVRSMFLFTNGIGEYYNYEHQFRDCFPEQSAHPNVSHKFFSGSDHTFTGHDSRQALVETVVEWMRRSSFIKASANREAWSV